MNPVPYDDHLSEPGLAAHASKGSQSAGTVLPITSLLGRG
jgi:hypothetical protein